jgi:hypothetical protein
VSPSRWDTGDAFLLTDSSILVNFCAISAGPALITYLGDRLFVVEAVMRELRRLAEKAEHGGLKRLLDEGWPETASVLPVDLEVEADIAAAMQFEATPETHLDENLGETATVLYAVAERDADREFQILTDDRGGKEKADQRGFRWTHSGMLAVEMVGAGKLSYDHGRRVWAKAVSAGGAAAYHKAVRAHHPEVALARDAANASKRAKKQKRSRSASARRPPQCASRDSGW